MDKELKLEKKLAAAQAALLEAETKLAEAETAFEAANTELTLTKEVNEELTKELEKLYKHASSTPVSTTQAKTFEFNENKYAIKFRSMLHKGNRITSDDVANDVKLQEELIAMGSGMIEEI